MTNIKDANLIPLGKLVRAARITVVIVLMAALTATLSACGSAFDIEPGTVGDGNFDSIVGEYIKNRNIPAATVVVTRDGEILESAAVGKRSFASATPVTENDHWQIGSLSKGITATLAARLIEQGFISWDTTIEGIFPAYLEQIHPDNHALTLAELLRHRSGLSRDLLPNDSEKASVDRLAFGIRALGEATASKRGTFNYSNVGYTVAGLMLGQATNMSWENAVQQFLFTPLEISEFGFGFPDAGANLLQPIGHIRRGALSGDRVNDYWLPVHPSDSQILDTLMVYAPAGAIYLSKQDYIKYQYLHLDGANDASEFLSQDSFNYLQVPPDIAGDGDDQAMGWWIMDEERLDAFSLSSTERVLEHGGNTGIMSANSIIFPDKNISVFIAVNSDVAAFDGLLKLVFSRLEITE